LEFICERENLVFNSLIYLEPVERFENRSICNEILGVWVTARAALYAVQNKKVFKERLNAGVERNVLRSVGRRFHACGAATETPSPPA